MTEAAVSHCTPAEAPGSRQGPFPTALAPMMAYSLKEAFDHRDWLFEPKLDGMRALAFVHPGSVRLVSRGARQITNQYPSIAAELARFSGEAVFDGEIVALGSDGRVSFELLQQRWGLTNPEEVRQAEQSIPVVFYVFDLLYIDGYDLRSVSLQARKELLSCTLGEGEFVRRVEYVRANGIAAFHACMEHGFEGVVAKHVDSVYESGKRSRRWLKIKATCTADLVIAGYSPGKGRREPRIGALAVGYYDRHGKLVFAGMVGTGLDDRTLGDLQRRLDAIKTEKNPFATKVPLPGAMTWVRPEVLVEVKYAELTSAGFLRAPVFLRLRPDKKPSEIGAPDRVPFGPTASLPVKISPLTAKRPDTTRQASGPSAVVSTQLERQIAAVVAQLEHCRESCVLDLHDHRLKVTNLHKVMWPAVAGRRALTKRDLLIYLCKVAPDILRYVRDRPLTLIRYPNGVFGGRFFQKQMAPRPEFVVTVRAPSESAEGGREHLLCNNLPSLLWLGQLADLELHAWLARSSCQPENIARHVWPPSGDERESLLNFPDFVLFDLDPYVYSGKEHKGAEPELNHAGFAKCCEVAFWLKDILTQMSLSSFVKTSGATGLHVFVPITRHFTYDSVRSIAGIIAAYVVQEHSHVVTTAWSVEKRTGKIFLDYNQNSLAKSLAIPFSPRANPLATVSMPLSWDQLGGIFPTDFTILTARDYVAAHGDAWANILSAKQDLSSLLRAQKVAE